MSEFVSGIWVVLFGLAVLGGIPYGIWVVFTAVKKRWRRVGFQIGIPLLGLLVLAGVSALDQAREEKRYLARLYGTEVRLPRPVFEYQSDRDFHGDGFSISAYELPLTIRARFENADEVLLSEFPKVSRYQDDWNIQRWTRGPFDEALDPYLNFILRGYDSGDTAEVSLQLALIQRALSRDGAYYAFFYKTLGDHPGDVDFFVVDLAGNRLYVVNQNT